MGKDGFEHFNLEESLIKGVEDVNFEKPREIENRIMGRILKGSKLIGE
ncbi:DEAD/DEAH box helicase family protein [Staphylococcus capitis]|nr:hypothetical protein [Staphylococcus capitis]